MNTLVIVVVVFNVLFVFDENPWGANINFYSIMNIFYVTWTFFPPKFRELEYPAKIYLLKVNNRNTKKGVKYVQN